jgi:ADP-heptose:LPS heptosyltransferase
MTDEAEKKRARAEHFRELAESLSDQQVVNTLIEKAGKLEREADEVEPHQEANE